MFSGGTSKTRANIANRFASISMIHRMLHLEGDLDADQRARLADIAERTPVTLTLKAGAEILTELAA